jgi:hypothetical protein
MREIETRPHCTAGLRPNKMRRRRVHRFPSIGRPGVCVDAEPKPRS